MLQEARQHVGEGGGPWGGSLRVKGSRASGSLALGMRGGYWEREQQAQWVWALEGGSRVKPGSSVLSCAWEPVSAVT